MFTNSSHADGGRMLCVSSMRSGFRIVVVLLACLAGLLAGASSASADYRSSARWFSAKADDDRLLLQSMLILTGYYNGLIDGVFGRHTYDSIVEYEAAQHLDADGVLTAAEEQSLRIAATEVYNGLGFLDQTDAATGIKMLVPTKLFTSHRPSDFGSHWESEDKGVELETLVIPETQTSFSRLLMRLSGAGDRKIEYSYVRDSIFVLSGEVGDRKFYTVFLRSGGLSQGFSISWTPAEDKIGRVVQRAFISDPRDLGSHSAFRYRLGEVAGERLTWHW